jgi:GntR family transcriptional regulator, transcriptional repressor for pyruvate dehydrogenase complex
MAKNPEKLAAAELVVDRVRALIEGGQLRSGDRLPAERELARELGVSRPSVRSGLKTLAAMGVVQIRQGAGTFITAGPPKLDSEPLSFLAALHGFTRSQMFEARLVLEVTVAGLAADRTRHAPERLIAISDETTGMFASLDNPDAFLDHDIRFHRAVAAAADNPILSSLVDMVSTMFRELRQRTIRNAHDFKLADEEHRMIYQAIRAHDPDRSRRAMSEHLQRALRTQMQEEDAAAAAAPAGAPEPGGAGRVQ